MAAIFVMSKFSKGPSQKSFLQYFLTVYQISCLSPKAISSKKDILYSSWTNSNKSSYMLKQKQNRHGHKDLCIIEAVPTRWNSSYYMVQQQQQPLYATLLEIHKTDLMPTESEFKTLEEFVLTVKPLVDITEAIGAEKWVTISIMRPILTKHTLLQQLMIVLL